MRYITLIFILLFTLQLNAQEKEHTLEDAIKLVFSEADKEANDPFVRSLFMSVCRVSNVGSGVVFAEDKDSVWVMTAGHVVTDPKGKLDKKIFVTFFTTGKQSHDMKAEKLWLNYKVKTTSDIAFLKVKKTEFKGYPVPEPIVIAPKDTKLKSGQGIFSCGCPKAMWPTAFKGHVVGTKYDRFTFIPQPLGGRSGSAVVTEDGIVGIIIWKTVGGKARYGTAISLAKIYEATDGVK